MLRTHPTRHSPAPLAVVFFLLLFAPSSALAQSPSLLEFTASADHDVRLPDGRSAVDCYQVEFILAGAAAPFQVTDIGKPVPDSADKVSYSLTSLPIAWPVAGASYEVRVTAVGPLGSGRSAPSTPFVVSSTSSAAAVPPQVWLTAPMHGSIFTAPATVKITASAKAGTNAITRVEFYKDETLVSADTASSYYATTVLPAGSYTLTATAVDANGVETTSTPVVISVANSTALPVLLPPRADAFVRGGYPGSNYGTSSRLEIYGSTKLSYIREGLIAFDLTTSPIGRKVALRLASRLDTQTAPITVGVYQVASTSWNELTVTYDTRPPSGASPLVTFTVGSTTTAWVEADVTAYVQSQWSSGRRQVAFALKAIGSSTTRTFVTSREGTYKPALALR